MRHTGLDSHLPSRTARLAIARLATLGLLALCALHPAAQTPPPAARSVIVQAGDLESAAHGVRRVGGEITLRLGIIGAVGVLFTAS